MTETEAPAQSAPESAESTPQGQAFDPQFLEALNQKFSEYDKALAESSTDKQTLERLKKAFAGEQEEKKQGKWLDKHLGKLLEARQRGQEMPITEDLVVELQKQMDETEELKDQLRKATEALQRMQNPATWQDNQVYSEMDNTLSGVLEKVYGEANPRMHELVSSTIADRLRQTRKEAPEIWEKIRNDKNLQRKVVMKAVSEIVPPQAMQMMRKQHEDSQPVTMELIQQAWDEAMQIEDQELRAKAKEALRQKLYSMKSPFRRRGA